MFCWWCLTSFWSHQHQMGTAFTFTVPVIVTGDQSSIQEMKQFLWECEMPSLLNGSLSLWPCAWHQAWHGGGLKVPGVSCCSHQVSIKQWHIWNYPENTPLCFEKRAGTVARKMFLSCNFYTQLTHVPLMFKPGNCSSTLLNEADNWSAETAHFSDLVYKSQCCLASKMTKTCEIQVTIVLKFVRNTWTRVHLTLASKVCLTNELLRNLVTKSRKIPVTILARETCALQVMNQPQGKAFPWKRIRLFTLSGTKVWPK